MITIIHGPMMSGKTFHRSAFMQKFGCTHVVDEWDPYNHELPDDGRLVLTLYGPDHIRQAIRHDRSVAQVRIIDITTARQLIGVTPHAPGIAERLSR